MPFLPETVRSLMAQSFKDFEILAIDDGSTDDTRSYLLALSDPRVRYHRLEKVGLVGALNYGISNARGRLIARLDGDDICHPDRLAKQFEYFNDNRECVLLGCDFDEIDAKGTLIGVNAFNVQRDLPHRWLLHFGTTFLHPGVMYPTECCRRLGGYDPRQDVTEDYDLWCRLSRIGPIGSLSMNLMKKRIHPQAVSVAKRERGLAQSSEIAARYTVSVIQNDDPEAAAALYWLVNTCTLRGVPLARVTRVYQELLKHYLPLVQDCDELIPTIRFIGHRLGYHCSKLAKQNWKKPIQAQRWMRARRLFDPSRHSVVMSLLSRMFSTRPKFSPFDDRIFPHS